MKQAPKHLKRSGREFFLAIQRVIQFEEPQDWARLLMAAECLDAIDTARKEIEKQGPFYTDRFSQPRAHPAFSLIRDQKTLFLRCCREMSLDLEQPETPRPPRQY